MPKPVEGSMTNIEEIRRQLEENHQMRNASPLVLKEDESDAVDLRIDNEEIKLAGLALRGLKHELNIADPKYLPEIDWFREHYPYDIVDTCDWCVALVWLLSWKKRGGELCM